jgi:RimJ/RimL family protein N-acetyltransferase
VQEQPAVPSLVSRRVALEPLVGPNLDFARHLLTDPSVVARFRFANAMPGPNEIERALIDRVASQVVIKHRPSGTPFGLAQLTNVMYRHGTGNLLTVLAPPFQRKPWVLEGQALFVEYVFASFPLRKLYGEVAAFNFAQFASGAGRLFTVEGRLQDHEWHFGRYWDVIILSLTRESWLASRNRRLLLRSLQSLDETDPGV